MYNPGYGFGGGGGAGGGGASNFGNNGPQQSNPQAMFNPQQQQQFSGLNQQAGFQGGANAQTMHGGQGMMQNMPNMGQNGQSGYQQQFPGAPFGQMGAGANPQNYNFMMSGGMPGFPMNQGGMPQQQQQQSQKSQQQHHHQQHQQHQQQQTPQPQPPPQQQQQGQQSQQAATQQHMMQRMQQQMKQGTGSAFQTPQRPQSSVQGTPQMSPQQHAQFRNSQSPRAQMPNSTHHNFQQASPHTPNHGQQGQQPPPPQQQLAQQGQQPVNSPGGNYDKERFALLLDINSELLFESLQLQNTMQELKKDPAMEGSPANKKLLEDTQQDFLQCMRRLQSNLTYMAALADRKPDVKLPPSPAYLSAPTLNLSLRLKVLPPQQPDDDASGDREGRDQTLKDLYRRLQAVFPGVDPKKEPAFRPPGPPQRPGMPGMNQASPTGQKPPQMGNMFAPQPSHSGVLS